MFIVIGKALSLISFFRKKFLGHHEYEENRFEELLNSFFIGIENIRKRKFRSILILTSIIIMVASTVSFTSLSSISVNVEQEYLPGSPSYTGILIRLDRWGQSSMSDLNEIFLNYIETKSAVNNVAIAPRAWQHSWFGSRIESNVGVPLIYGSSGYNVSYEDKGFTVIYLLGLSPEEKQVTGVEMYEGTWFQESDALNIAIISENQARYLGINSLPAVINIEGIPYKVIGIVDADLLNSFKDLDGEMITPQDLSITPDTKGWTEHISIEDCIILPYRTVVDRYGGRTSSISLYTKNETLIDSLGTELSEQFSALNVYFYHADKVLFFSKMLQLNVWGLNNQIIPIAIVSLSVLNIAIASVYERKRDIFIYATVGLSPRSVGFMFLSETLLFAVLGSLVGFIIGNFMTQSATTVLPITISYTLNTLIYSVGISFICIIGSSIYPILLASKLVTPSLERTWKITTRPEGDTWTVPIPFTISGEKELKGMLAFISEFMKSHAFTEAQDFNVRNLEYNEEEKGEERFKSLKADVALQPYETGVNQEVTIQATVSGKRWNLRIILIRKAGLTDLWERLNRNLIDQIRKQVLLWRSISIEQRKKYEDSKPI
jgi:ABC-type antimicrobial peptide transport system permease subunit